MNERNKCDKCGKFMSMLNTKAKCLFATAKAISMIPPEYILLCEGCIFNKDYKAVFSK